MTSFDNGLLKSETNPIIRILFLEESKSSTVQVQHWKECGNNVLNQSKISYRNIWYSLDSTFIITDISSPWWDFVMVGICWVTTMMLMMMTMVCLNLREIRLLEFGFRKKVKVQLFRSNQVQPNMVGFCHGGNMLGNHDDDDFDENDDG